MKCKKRLFPCISNKALLIIIVVSIVIVVVIAVTVPVTIAVHKSNLKKKGINSGNLCFSQVEVSAVSYNNSYFEWFEKFRMENMVNHTEPLFLQKFGKTLRIELSESAGFWNYNSFYSYCVSFRTSLHAETVISYGKSDDTALCADKTGYYFQHLHYIKNLEPGTKYHYRITARGVGGEVVVSDILTFTTQSLPANGEIGEKKLIRVPDDIQNVV
jgi:hypothetical protein